jgi:hypothetical protein
MEISCPFTAGERYRVRRASEHPLLHLDVGEILRFKSPILVTNTEEPEDKTVMFSFFSAQNSLPRLWYPFGSETLDSWREYFEELTDNSHTA